MSSRKCLSCGMVGFATAEKCKRCSATFGEAPVSSEPTVPPMQSVTNEDKPRSSFSPLRVLLLVLIIVGISWYYFRSGDEARAQQEQKDKQFQLKRAEENQRLQMGRCMGNPMNCS